MKNPTFRKIIRNFIIEMLMYAALVVGYFLLVLRFLDDPLEWLFSNNLILYALVALVLIVVQAVLLEAVTSLIIGGLGLEQLE